MVAITQPKICPGCGQVMQDTDPSLSNYVLSLDLKLCMRCFRWRHYKDLPMLINPVINIEEPDAPTIPAHDEVLVVVDGFMMEETLLPLLSWIKDSNKVSVVATKFDLFPKQISQEHIIDQITSLLSNYDTKVDHVFVSSIKWEWTIAQLREYVLTKEKNTRFLVLGMINAGKSSLLNALMKQPDLTTSPYPQTTLDPIDNTLEHITLIDMPGFSNPNHLFYHIEPELYQKIMPETTIKPQIFQLKGKQTIMIDQLLMIHMESEELISCSVYASNKLSVVRKKTKEELTEKLACDNPRTTVLKPSLFGLDFIIEGIGHVHLVGDISALSVEHHPRLTIKKSRGTLLW
jgi:ribosome biogenesis GTPase A